MTDRTKEILLKTFGLIFCTVPVISAIILYFPIWRERGAATALSGFTLLLIILSLLPFFNTVKRWLRSPAAHTMWFIVFVLFFLLSKIADEMTVISFVGFVGNFIGAILFKAARKKSARAGGEKNEG